MASGIPDIHFDYEHLTLEHLDYILPVTETHPLGEFEITLLSLECYRHGTIATFSTVHRSAFPADAPRSDPPEMPSMLRGMTFMVDAVDDLGNRYAARTRAGHGGGRLDGSVKMRLVYALAPAGGQRTDPYLDI